MALASGRKLGPYEVGAPLGAGGMLAELRPEGRERMAREAYLSE